MLPMDWNAAGDWTAAAAVIAALFLFPRWFSFRHRAMAGAMLFPLGLAGIFGALALGDRPFMQSEYVAWLWLGISALAIVLAITLLVPVFFEWRRKRHRQRRSRESWSAGHSKN
jgi:uncharacterized membrane protein YcjF (UPF0283 family)